jgi:hypothetical protein
MKITAQDREQVRLCILRYCLRPTSVGLICANLRGEGFRGIERDQVQAEIDYLADPQKGLLATDAKVVSPENKIWRTTATGRDYLADQGQENE